MEDRFPVGLNGTERNNWSFLLPFMNGCFLTPLSMKVIDGFADQAFHGFEMCYVYVCHWMVLSQLLTILCQIKMMIITSIPFNSRTADFLFSLLESCCKQTLYLLKSMNRILLGRLTINDHRSQHSPPGSYRHSEGPARKDGEKEQRAGLIFVYYFTYFIIRYSHCNAHT